MDLQKLDQSIQAKERPFRTFRTIVYTAFREYARINEKPFGKEKDAMYKEMQFDFCFSEGIDSYADAVYGDILFDPIPSKMLIESFLERKFKGRTGPRYYWAALPFVRERLPLDYLETVIDKHCKDTKVRIVALDDLAEYWKHRPKIVFEHFPKLAAGEILPIIEKVTAPDYQWRTENEERIEALRQRYIHEGLVLFLGAGVSMEYGVPSWNNLLSRLFFAVIRNIKYHDAVDISKEELGVMSKALQTINDKSPLYQARYIDVGLGKKFQEEVTKNLYKDRKTSLRKKKKEQNLKSPETLPAIVELCRRTDHAQGVQSVVTYNFDDLLEAEMIAMARAELEADDRPAGKIPTPISVYHEDGLRNKDGLQILHVHGFLPQDINAYPGALDSFLVFSERNYHQLMEDPNHWANMEQLKYFRRQVCLFIGLSATDPNQRRILELAAKSNQGGSLFAIMKRDKNDVFEEAYKEGGIELDAPGSAANIELMNQIHHELAAKTFKELGINIIWVQEYDDIPGILKRVVP